MSISICDITSLPGVYSTDFINDNNTVPEASRLLGSYYDTGLVTFNTVYILFNMNFIFFNDIHTLSGYVYAYGYEIQWL